MATPASFPDTDPQTPTVEVGKITAPAYINKQSVTPESSIFRLKQPGNIRTQRTDSMCNISRYPDCPSNR